jgi:26S proteasome regulatory subunit N3
VSLTLYKLPLPAAVRIGDIQAFNRALTSHTPQFTTDRTLTLIHRLRHTVLKTALRTLSLSYSRISLRDISQKLALDSEEDAEYVVAKAIRDGVVNAKVDHEKGEMRSEESGDVYATGEPVREFDRRIQFLLELHNQSVKVRFLESTCSFSFFSLLFFRSKTDGSPIVVNDPQSMRYPLNAHSKELASADEARERERELVRLTLPSPVPLSPLPTPPALTAHRKPPSEQAKEIEEGDEDADLDGPGDMDSF